MRALDLFCGAGGATKGLQQAGFHVTGIDINPQPNYCGDIFVQADFRELAYLLSAYELIWASPPCQRYTNAQRIQSKDHPDFIPHVRRLLQSSGVPWVIENVIGAPLIDPVELCGGMFGLRTYRHRIFETNFPIVPPAHPKHIARNAKMGRPAKNDEFIHVVGNFSGIATAREAMNIDWMTRNELREAIPPAYSKFIAESFLKTLKAAA